MQLVFTQRVNAPALLSACHFVYFVYFVVSPAVFCSRCVHLWLIRVALRFSRSQRAALRSEARCPKSEGNQKSEIRRACGWLDHFGFRASDFTLGMPAKHAKHTKRNFEFHFCPFLCVFSVFSGHPVLLSDFDFRQILTDFSAPLVANPSCPRLRLCQTGSARRAAAPSQRVGRSFPFIADFPRCRAAASC